jgi:glycosyltransferase involved in cell wall biosynthesis
MRDITAPYLTIVVNFFNMQREAERTLYSLTPEYQLNTRIEDYEVIAVDNGSSKPLNESWVTALSPNFKYIYHKTTSPSPCAAMNRGIEKSRSLFTMCIIDGARILSPGIVHYSIIASKLYDHPFIYTLSMHIGGKPQNVLIRDGYNQDIEDGLIDGTNWKANGYDLFKIATPAPANKDGFFSQLWESNCFTVQREDLLNLNLFDERFQTPGGGYVCADHFHKVHQDDRFTPIMLLGEATFHQFHGGITSNVAFCALPPPDMVMEYKQILGKSSYATYRNPVYFGSLPEQCKPFMNASRPAPQTLNQRVQRKTKQFISGCRRHLWSARTK